MPSSSRLTELCRYHYDPLDRQAGCTLTLVQPATLQRFYCKSRLATEIQGAAWTRVFQHDDQLLAQQRHQNGKVDTTLLATDQQRSVLSVLDTTRPHPLAYSPYGHRPAENGLLSLLGFNGEQPDPITGCYHLGNGYRQFNPVLMRFNSPDSWSPFGEGGLNAYAYVEGDPTNRNDPTGHIPKIFKPFLRAIGVIKKPPQAESPIKIGKWELLTDDPERVVLANAKPKKPEPLEKMGLEKNYVMTQKEADQFHQELEKAYRDGKRADQLIAARRQARTSSTIDTSTTTAPVATIIGNTGEDAGRSIPPSPVKNIRGS